MSGSPRRVLPVVRWLQMGAASAGFGLAVGMASLATPGVAWADNDTASASSDSARQSTQRPSGAQRSAVPRSARGADAGPRANRPAGPARAAADARGSDPLPEVAPASSVRATALAAKAPAAAVESAAAPSAAASTPAQIAASAPASAAPGLGSLAATVRLNLEDLFTGTGRPAVTNPTAVVTGLFREVLRRDPTVTELQDYLRRLNISGVNGVVAGLYNSRAFRQNSVNNYYLEFLGRTPSAKELNWGTLRLTLGNEPMFAASLAGDQEFYDSSASGGGKFGTQTSATTYVDLLYRTLLGQAAGPEADPLIQQVQGGFPIARAANQFVRTNAYRTVKVGEVYSVLGQEPSPTDIAEYADRWLWSGGQAGISMSLLATAANVQRIEAGLVPTPNVTAAAQLQQLLLAAYNDSPEGFTKLFNQLLSLDPNSPISAANPCTPSNTSCNQPLYTLVTTGGRDRGIPNSSLVLTSLNADVATLVPSQNEIDLRSSLRFPLQNPTQLASYFTGGLIQPFGNPVLTADGGTYIVDGHHRWSQIYLVNPFTQVTAVDLGYVPTPQTALKEAQMGVLAAKGYLASATVQGENLYTITEPVFDLKVRELIEAGDTPEAVLEVFGTYLGFKTDIPEDEQYAIVTNYLWGNVLRMRELNPFIPGAPSRGVMPQTDPLPVTQGYLDSGDLSYSFPTISYLG